MPILRVFLATLFLLANAALIEGFKSGPPYQEFAGVDAAIREADQAEAPRYDPALYAMAMRLRGAAQTALDTESQRFRWIRDYDGVRSYLAASRSLAVASARRAEAGEQGALAKLEVRLAESADVVAKAFREVEGYPYRGSVRRSLAEGSLLHARAAEAFRAGETLTAAELLDRADTLLARSQSAFESEFGGYLDKTSTWEKWARAAIARSKASGGSLILVDKMRRHCYLYERGRLVDTYSADLGTNWVGHKRMSGDRATPEGNYLVSEKKANGATKYYKALLINYPNADDKARFTAAKRAGRIPESARIGNLIEIHGDGGRGYDWTLGCVALTNKDMDRLYSRVAVGTPVLIVGTLPEQLASAR
ncbi:MAG: murein L,D-transpeptidase family protein [bacterium]